MAALLDTHIFLHMLTDPAQLSQKQRDLVRNLQTRLFLSFASIWEITIKHGLRKLQLPTPPHELFPARLLEFRIELLPITLNHILRVEHLPHHHGDPFDRLIIAQAQLENLPVVSSDHRFPPYLVEIIS